MNSATRELLSKTSIVSVYNAGGPTYTTWICEVELAGKVHVIQVTEARDRNGKRTEPFPGNRQFSVHWAGAKHKATGHKMREGTNVRAAVVAAAIEAASDESAIARFDRSCGGPR